MMNFTRSLGKVGIYELICILQLGIGTMFMFIGLDTHSFILESVLHSVNTRDPNRIDQYAGYYGQACSYMTFALANLFAPSLIRLYDPKWSVFIGSLFSTVYYLGFQYINSYYFYVSAVLLGIGSAVFYTGHGCYLTEHSEEKHLARNASLSWAIACMSFTSGGLILILILHNDDTSDTEGHREFSDSMIRWIFGVFALCCVFSNVTFFFLQNKKVEAGGICTVEPKSRETFKKAILQTFRTFRKSNIWWLGFSWLYLGITTSFMLGVYPTTLMFTESLSKSNTLIAFYSFCISFGELSIAFVISSFSHKFRRFGRVPTAVIGFFVHSIAHVLVLFFTPRYASLKPTKDDGLLFEPNFYVALLSGYLMGIADGCWNTVRCCIVPLLLPDNRAEGFSISKAFQSLASFAIFFLSPKIDLYVHIAILVVFNVIATATFTFASIRYDRRRTETLVSKQAETNINSSVIDFFASESKLDNM